jgi:CheY-like chemotaxis protein
LAERENDTFGRARKDITIHRDLSEDLSAIEADQGQIEQVLLNLYVNAADAMPDGGDLSLKTMNATHEDMKEKPYDPNPGNYVLLKATDTGIGMEEEVRKRIFDPFFTTKEMGRGTGLGLASAYGIIKNHGGYVDVQSEKGHGTTFSIYFPASDQKVYTEIEKNNQITEGTGTILLVDDEEIVLDVGAKMLENLGYTVFKARSGNEAVDTYEENKDHIDMIILDMVMPQMAGGEAYDRLKEIDPNARVLLSSGYSIEGQAKEILRRGCAGFIQKPFGMEELGGKTREILANR